MVKNTDKLEVITGLRLGQLNPNPDVSSQHMATEDRREGTRMSACSETQPVRRLSPPIL